MEREYIVLYFTYLVIFIHWLVQTFQPRIHRRGSFYDRGKLYSIQVAILDLLVCSFIQQAGIGWSCQFHFIGENNKLLQHPSNNISIFLKLIVVNTLCNLFSPSLCFNSGSEGTLGCLLHQYPKLYNNVFLFVSSTVLGLLLNFDWLVYLVECSFQPLILIYRWGNLLNDKFIFKFGTN